MVLDLDDEDEQTRPDPELSAQGDEEGWDSPKRREFLKLRVRSEEMEQEAAKSFDKAMLTLSAGAFALSVAFLEKIAPSPRAWTCFFLVPAWGGFLFSIYCVLMSFLIGQEMCRDWRRHWDRQHNPDEADAKPSRRHARYAKKYGRKDPFGEAVDAYNWRAIYSFVLGAGFLAAFSLANIIVGGLDERERGQARSESARGEAGAGVQPASPAAQDVERRPIWRQEVTVPTEARAANFPVIRRPEGGSGR